MPGEDDGLADSEPPLGAHLGLRPPVGPVLADCAAWDV